jgi:hypothetical protein
MFLGFLKYLVGNREWFKLSIALKMLVRIVERLSITSL